MRNFLLAIVIAGMTLISCTKDPVIDITTKSSTESIIGYDVNGDGDLSDSITQQVTTTDGAITDTSDWSVSSDVNPDFFGNNNGMWATHTTLETAGGYFTFWHVIQISGQNTRSWALPTGYDESDILCQYEVIGGLGVTPVISNHSRTSITFTYINVDGSLVGMDGRVDVVLQYERVGNYIRFSEHYFVTNQDVLLYEVIGNYGLVTITVADILSAPDCGLTGKSNNEINTLSEFIKLN